MTQLDIRRTALSSLNLSEHRTGHVGDSKHNSTGHLLAESLKKPFQARSRCAGLFTEGEGDSPPKQLWTGPVRDVIVAREDNDKTLVIRKVLKIFREIDQRRLA